MPVGITGLTTDIDTQDLINKLVDVEKRPIIRMENERDMLEFKVEVLEVMDQHLSQLRESVKDLYGFRVCESLTSISDEHAKDYDQSMAEASISYSATNDILSIQWATNIGHIEFHDFLIGDYVSAADVLGQGEVIYGDQQAYMQ